MGIRRLSAVASVALACMASLASAQQPTTQQATTQPLTVGIDVDLSAKVAPWTPVHHYFGCDEPNYAYSSSGQALLNELGKLGTPDQPVFFRTHNLMTTGDGEPALKWGSTNLYTEDAQGNPVYDFTIVDRIFDAYLKAGVRPYVQLGFMPEALSTKPQPYRHHWDPKQPYDAIYTGWAYPPKDYRKWEEVCFTWAKHCLERYGQAEVERWYWETWNEANIPYWKGTAEEFRRLHDHAIAGVRRAIPKALVGGPDFAGDGGRLMDEFIAHVLDGTNFATGEKGTPTDFLSHHAKGSPKAMPEGYVRMGLSNQLGDCDRSFARFAKDPRTKPLPIVIGEFDPEGCAACQGANLAYRNGTMYSTYTAISFARAVELADHHGVNLDGLLTWAFLFDGQPPFAGFRVLASSAPDGGIIEHPVLNTFRLLSGLSGDRVRVRSDQAAPLMEVVTKGVRDEAEVNALATTAADGRVAVLLWHYHDDDLPGPDANVTLNLSHLPAGGAKPARVTLQRVDATHANTFNAWQAAGSPKTPTGDQLATIRKAGQLVTESAALQTADGKTTLTLAMPRQSVVLVTIDAAK